MINLKEFKQAVLQKAMQGKLTKQLPSDGNAKDLLVKIANYKRDLVQVGELKGYSKPLPPVTDKEIPFKIPNNWEWTRLANFYTFINGYQPKRNKCSHEKKPDYIRLYLISDYTGNTKNWYISKKYAKRISNTNDILIANVGASLGRIFKAKYGAYNGHLVKISPISYKYKLNKYYVWYYLHSYLYQSFVYSIERSKLEASLSKKNFRQLIIPLPPLAEQQRIISKVHKCFLLADMIQRERDLHHKFAHDMKQSLLLEAMKGHLTQQLPSDSTADDLLQKIQQKKQQLIQAGKIRNHKKLPPISKNEIPFKIPKNWCWVRLGTICPILEVPTVSKNEYQTDGIPFYRIKDITELNKGIKPNISVFISKSNYLSKIRNKGKVKKNDILIVATGATLGGSYVLNSNDHIYFQGSNNIIWIKDLFKLDSYFINSIFKMNLFYKMVRHMSKGSAIKHLNIGLLSNLLIPLPPLSEQYRIVSKLHDLFNTINA